MFNFPLLMFKCLGVLQRIPMHEYTIFSLTDYLKLKVICAKEVNNLWSHPLLYFHSKTDYLDKETGEIKGKLTKQYNGMIFVLEGDIMYIHLRPHYYYNDNRHNANDFTALCSIQVLIEIIDLLRINPCKLFVIGLEFGLNLHIPKTLISIIDLMSRLYSHNRNKFYQDKKYPFCSYSTSVNSKGKSGVYKIIKAYAKSIQFPTIGSKNIFRFEVKSMRKAMINKLGIITLDDLLKVETYNILKNELKKEFSQVLIIDDTVIPNISTRRLKTHIKRQNPIYWNGLNYKSRNVFRNNFNEYYKDLDTCTTHLKKELTMILVTKLNDLFMCADLNPYKGEIRTSNQYETSALHIDK